MMLSWQPPPTTPLDERPTRHIDLIARLVREGGVATIQMPSIDELAFHELVSCGFPLNVEEWTDHDAVIAIGRLGGR